MTRIFNDRISFIDLFAGIGGFHIAMKNHNARCVFVSEKDKHAQRTYTHNHLNDQEEQMLIHGDITQIPAAQIPEHDILCGGFPCQPFSISGNQLGFEDARGTMFFEIIRIIQEHRPSIVFLENVANLRGHAGGKTLENMRDMLENEGYRVFYQILNASDFGVPQSRKRIYFVAFHERLNVQHFDFPSPLEETIKLRDILEPEETINERFYINRPDIFLKSDEEILELKNLKLNQPIRIGTINKGGQGDRIYSIEGHAITLSAEGGGAGAKTGAYLVDGNVRKLTTRECLRVQGYPETFEFPEDISLNQAYKQLGNTVAIPVLESIVSSICNLDELRELTIESDNITEDYIDTLANL